MDMCSRKFYTFLFLILLVFTAVFFNSCDEMGTILPSSGKYKINIQINDIPLDECSFVMLNDNLRPFFEESVSNDQDVTSLMVFLRNSRGESIGSRLIYSLDQNESAQADNEEIVFVDSLDDDLPLFTIPVELPMDIYTIVFQVMSGRDVLQRIEKSIYFLGENDFSYEGINVYLPGIADSVQLIPRETIVMLEANVDFSSDLDPYIIWYEGRRKLNEGRISEGAGQLFWKSPEQSGFFSLRAEIFPVWNFDRLAGYKKEISLLVSTKMIDMHLVSENIPQLVNWYTFEANLNDSKAADSSGTVLNNAESDPQWMGVNGTYGIVTGFNNIIYLTNVLIPENGNKTWQILLRFFPINDGGIFSIIFDSSGETGMHLFREGLNYILTLTSPLNTISQIFSLPDTTGTDIELPFLTAGINFSILPGSLSAHINIMNEFLDNDLEMSPVILEVDIEDEFQVFLGFLPENNNTNNESTNRTMAETIALWDEFAIYFVPPMEIIIQEVAPLVTDDSTQN